MSQNLIIQTEPSTQSKRFDQTADGEFFSDGAFVFQRQNATHAFNHTNKTIVARAPDAQGSVFAVVKITTVTG